MIFGEEREVSRGWMTVSGSGSKKKAGKINERRIGDEATPNKCRCR
jgi:hypothetical protein